MGKERNKKRFFDFREYPKRRIALRFCYFGWQFDGLVEEHIMNALLKSKLIESWPSCSWNRCGRTDKGVSSFGQTASLIIRSNDANGEGVFWPDGCENETVISKRNSELPYVRILNALLPKGIRVLAWAPASIDFNARHNCTERVYTYSFPKLNLDVKAMQKACEFLIGEHDFRNFCRIDMNEQRVQMSYVRTILFASINLLPELGLDTTSEKQDSISYEKLQLIIKGSGFLWQQIRCIMAVLYEIGCGNEKPEVIKQLLDIKQMPSKPVYGLVSGLPLCLSQCSFEGVELKWQWDSKCLTSIYREMLKTWTEYVVKATLTHNMIAGLEQIMPELANNDNGVREFINSSSNQTKPYVPLTKRPRCDSLETKKAKILSKKV